MRLSLERKKSKARYLEQALFMEAVVTLLITYFHEVRGSP